jgi:hypothetical protein
MDADPGQLKVDLVKEFPVRTSGYFGADRASDKVCFSFLARRMLSSHPC